MAHHKISKLLKDSTASKFVTRKWIEVNDLSGNQYSVNKNIRFKISMLRSDFQNYSDAYIVAKRIIDLGFAGNNDMTQKCVVFKNNTPLRPCISKTNNTFTDNAEDLDIVMLM